MHGAVFSRFRILLFGLTNPRFGPGRHPSAQQTARMTWRPFVARVHVRPGQKPEWKPFRRWVTDRCTWCVKKRRDRDPRHRFVVADQYIYLYVCIYGNMMGTNKSYCIVAARGTRAVNHGRTTRYMGEGWFPKLAFFPGVRINVVLLLQAGWWRSSCDFNKWFRSFRPSFAFCPAMRIIFLPRSSCTIICHFHTWRIQGRRTGGSRINHACDCLFVSRSIILPWLRPRPNEYLLISISRPRISMLIYESVVRLAAHLMLSLNTPKHKHSKTVWNNYYINSSKWSSRPT